MRLAHGLSRTRLFALLSTVAVVVLASACGSGSSTDANGNTRLTVSYSETVADELPMWIAVDGGYFKKQGLDVTLTEITGKDGVPALLSGQVNFASIGGSEVLSAVANGADLKYLATVSPIYAFQLYAQPQFAAPGALKGQRVGITSTSGSLYFATILALQELGLSPTDVGLTPLGSVTNVNNSLLSGNIAAAVSHPPATAQFEQHNLKLVVDLATKKIPAAVVGVAAQTSYAQAHPDITVKFLQALIQAVHREKTDKAYAEQVLRKYMKVNDQKALDETYAYYVNEVVPDIPRPDVAQFQTAQADLAKQNAKVAAVNLANLVDTSYINKAAAAPGMSK
jgi:NitT/TauT family transport system substrate-binding protein